MDQDTRWTSGLTIGLDVSDRRSQACVLDEGGRVCQRFSFATTQVGLEKAFGSIPAARVVLEVGTHSPWMSRRLEAWGHEALVANAKELRSIAHNTVLVRDPQEVVHSHYLDSYSSPGGQRPLDY